MRLKRSDLRLIAGVIIAAAFLYVLRFAVIGRTKGNYVEVSINGSLVGTYSIYENRTERFESKDGGYNIMVIADGGVSVAGADCPDGHCVKKGVVSRENEAIICLPHRLVIKVAGEGHGVDAVAR